MSKDDKLPEQKEKTPDPLMRNAYPDADENSLMRNEHPGADENPNEDEMKTIHRGGSRQSFPVDPEKEHQDDTTKPRRR